MSDRMTAEQTLAERFDRVNLRMPATHSGKALMTFTEEEIDIIRQALSAPRVPDGWKLVPNKLTQEMIDAGAKHCFNKDSHDEDEKYRAVGEAICVWSEMLAAAPEPVAQAPAEQLCKHCGGKTMHVGDVCYSCSHPPEQVAPELPRPEDFSMYDGTSLIDFIAAQKFDVSRDSSAQQLIADLRAEVEALKAELSVAKKDSERLDFLEHSHGDGHFQVTLREGIPEFDVEVWYNGKWLVGDGTELREAIDAARLREGGGK